ncbi:uncharacterized protein LOC133825839 [Humulus lupulus]|uniref:uncharacterized protein LOC133825839 n=1 Tax=Humulus lupulus TaxID=3486 RepID=UPI002B414D43|nr:uncharacterized protein LOC133825839 [Humulus lupulus]
MMMALKFPLQFIKLVMVCVTTPRFSFMINGAQIGCLKSRRGLRQGDPLSHFLVVIGMEYLSRIMISVGQHKDFKYHPRCEYLKLNHLCFADDLLLFSEGTFKAIYVLLRGFQLFTDSSSLQANKKKSAIFGVGLQEGDWNRLTGMTWFVRSNLPFKYLGMAISNTRISKADCECLVDKMVKRIRSWSSRNLSFAGRCILINYVLLSINIFWSQLVILPRVVITRINQICRVFLWKGTDYMEEPGRVSWIEIGKSKQKGGLSFTDISIWNICALGRYVWAIAKKEDNLWVKWVHSVYIKETDWWDYTAPLNSSWYWKRVVKTKNELKEIFLHSTNSWPIYNIAQMYKLLKDKTDTRWKFSFICDRLGIPKHKFET